MGAYYTYCQMCGTEISGRYSEEDDPESEDAPKEVSRKLREHVDYGECPGARAASKVFAIMSLFGLVPPC